MCTLWSQCVWAGTCMCVHSGCTCDCTPLYTVLKPVLCTPFSVRVCALYTIPLRSEQVLSYRSDWRRCETPAGVATPGVATLRCCHLAILCSISGGLVSAPLTERDHLPKEDVEKGFGGEPRGLLWYWGQIITWPDSGVTRGAGILGVVTLKCIILTHF